MLEIVVSLVELLGMCVTPSLVCYRFLVSCSAVSLDLRCAVQVPLLSCLQTASYVDFGENVVGFVHGFGLLRAVNTCFCLVELAVVYFAGLPSLKAVLLLLYPPG